MTGCNVNVNENVNVICLRTEHQRVHTNSVVHKCPCIPGSNWNLEMLVLRRGETGVPGLNTSRSRVENQQQTQPTYDARSGNRTQTTLVGGERSHRPLRQPCSPGYWPRSFFPSLLTSTPSWSINTQKITLLLADIQPS